MELEIVCDNCGKDVDAYLRYDKIHESPCTGCLETERGINYDKGYADGLDAED